MKISIQVLGSTSSGNCTAIWNRKDSILVDCGFSPRYTSRNLEHNRLSLSMLSGVLITHTHTDHVHESMLKRLRKEQVPVFCHRNVSRVLLKQYSTMRDAKKLDLIRTFKNEIFTIGSFTIQAFEVPHDSKGGCFGFTIYHHSDSSNKKITVATDMGYPQNDTLTHFLDSDVIIIESNHDQDMLTQSLRPTWLKKRIKKIGHLSNEQCTDFLEQVLSHSKKKPKAIILAHISQECNTNAHAIQCVQKMLQQNNHSDVEIVQTYKRTMNKCISI